MKEKATPPDPLSPAIVRMLLLGWDEVQHLKGHDPETDAELLTLFQVGETGVARLWRDHEVHLRHAAVRLGIEREFTAHGDDETLAISVKPSRSKSRKGTDGAPRIMAATTSQLRKSRALSARLDAIEHKIDRLLARFHPPSTDPADAHLLTTINAATQDEDGEPLAFTVIALRRRTLHHPQLADALRSADLTNNREIGNWCSRMTGVEIDGVRLDRVGDARDGAVWRVLRV